MLASLLNCTFFVIQSDDPGQHQYPLIINPGSEEPWKFLNQTYPRCLDKIKIIIIFRYREQTCRRGRRHRGAEQQRQQRGEQRQQHQQRQ